MAASRNSVHSVILTSRENFVWHSMQEIIPAIERAWKRSSEDGVHQVTCLNIDEMNFGSLVSQLIRADVIIQTCFTYKMCRIAEFVRGLHLDARFIIHLHNQATIACWPFHVWGMGNHLVEDDIFVSSCSRDAETMRHSFENGTTQVIPFTNPEQELLNRSLAPAHLADTVPLVFIGRLSSQKNLHLLLYAFRLWLDSKPRQRAILQFFGREDFLGSPNMGIGCDNYESTLLSLVDRLDLGSHVSFRGHKERTELYNEVFASRHIIVSPSLHSDENFGMAVFRSLCAGNLALLSDWGGHADFSRSFPHQVLYVPAHRSAAGPVISPRELADALDSAITSYSKETGPSFPESHTEVCVSKQFKELALRSRRSRNPLIPTELARRLLTKRTRFAEGNPRSMRIFESYADPDSEPFFRGYGMSQAIRRPPGACAAEHLVPWARFREDGAIVADDPHRGFLQAHTREEALALGLIHA